MKNDPDDAKIDVLIEDERWGEALGDASLFAKKAAMKALGQTDRSGAFAVLLADDGAVRELNLKHRGKDAPTNVLSFPAVAPPGDRRAFGDIALAYETIAREAGEQGKAFEQHAAHMLVHGVLHLVGYDHQTDGEAEVMEAQERAVLAALGYGDPYANERTA